MKTLAFDTSTKYLSIACLDEGSVKAEYHKDVGIRHSEILVSEIRNMLDGLGWQIPDIELICVGTGPGSFTGLRIAIATVKGLSAILDTKVIGVPTMDAMVMNIPASDKKIAPFIDARKNKVYSCIYDNSSGEPKKLTDYILLTVEELLSQLKEKVIFFGDAVSKYEKELDNHPMAEYINDADWYPQAVNIGKIGFARSQSGTDDPEDLSPLYLHAKECNINK